MYSVRTANIEDSKGINSISQYLGYSELSNDESHHKLQHLLNSQTDVVYVAEIKGTIIGWLHLFIAHRLASPDFYEIGGLVVNPNNRNQGIGKALVDKAVKQHAGKIRVRCNEKRTESHRFYEAVGFKSTKAQRIFEKRT